MMTTMDSALTEYQAGTPLYMYGLISLAQQSYG